MFAIILRDHNDSTAAIQRYIKTTCIYYKPCVFELNAKKMGTYVTNVLVLYILTGIWICMEM